MPSQVVASDNLRNLDIESRQCRFLVYLNLALYLLYHLYRFEDEAEGLRLFKTYSQRACQFECALINSHKQCGCIPWDYPRTDQEFGTVPICDMYSSYCFAREMKNVGIYLAYFILKEGWNSFVN